MNQKSQPLQANVLITGTPGVGKTTLSRLLVGELNELDEQISWEFIELARLIIDNKLYTSWNQEFNVPEFDQDMVVDFLEEKLKTGSKVVEFHSSGFFPERWFDLVVLLRTNNTQLYDRLALREYSQSKISENIECEIMDVTKDQVMESYKKERILELRSDELEDVEKNIHLIIEKLRELQEENKLQKF